MGLFQPTAREGRQGMKSLEGQKAPAFSLEGNDGKKHSLEDYHGKNVVLFFTQRTAPRAEPKKLAGSAT